MEIILIHETMCSSEEAIEKLKGKFKQWQFYRLDAHGLLRLNLVGWNSHNFLLLNSYAIQGGLIVNLQVSICSPLLTLLNIYGHYNQRKEFLKRDFDSLTLKKGDIIMGGNIIFTLSIYEVWGSSPRINSVADHILHKMDLLT